MTIKLGVEYYYIPKHKNGINNIEQPVQQLLWYKGKPLRTKHNKNKSTY